MTLSHMPETGPRVFSANASRLLYQCATSDLIASFASAGIVGAVASTGSVGSGNPTENTIAGSAGTDVNVRKPKPSSSTAKVKSVSSTKSVSPSETRIGSITGRSGSFMTSAGTSGVQVYCVWQSK